MSELARRVVVALLGAPVALAVIWVGGAPLATLVGGLAGVAAWELARMARAAGHEPMGALGVLLAALLPLAVHAHVLGVVRVPLVVGVLAVVAVLGAAIWLRGVEGKPLGAAATTVFIALYTGATLSYAYALRYHNYAVGDVAGALVVIFPVVLTWASDTGAYFSGRLIGGRKLIPSVSPGKTVAGAVGALVVTVLVAYAFMRYLLTPKAQLAFTPWGLVLFALTISVVAQIGDLAESLLKREAGVKDSGTLFPGHGGVLDRLDSLFFVLPAAYALYDLLLIPAPGA
ncbi:MAG: phosphatidate cytidylyltransferase [Gemmatimonas sp.]|uniref:phosphatidate cytidylyltransferase n=1 Tax=Gemmatimonas sp. TaxID=1962908 RepID=UPI00391FA8C8|nr:phosphatidate cytidylyltransferase [Gemmatimonadota bacterium]